MQFQHLDLKSTMCIIVRNDFIGTVLDQSEYEPRQKVQSEWISSAATYMRLLHPLEVCSLIHHPR